ncbi:probable asparagine--tRNA ligase, mitochondrial isoform X2 [Cephus cinctus]|uniref:asparagine--tRNA ligase n=1 Tax=Cephus cinctus TaxID=211228 RepID=A0AAJ7C6X7_CEPCN|nr:probable asparagine--tRNA ligase, mitochondrial isoform X2 [Cephus cinctus]
MILRNFSRIFSSKLISKREAHNFARIAEANAKEAVGKRTLGWIRAVRKMKDNIFLDINDGSCCEYLQVVVPKSNKPNNLTYGSSVSVEGELALAPNGRTELRAESISVIGACDVTNGYPFVPRKQYSTEYVRKFLHLRPRTRGFASVLRLRDIASSAVADHFRERSFINVHTPIITSNDCEGAGEVFLVRPDSHEILTSMKKDNIPEEQSYFDTKAYLTVSGQLHLEALARGLGKVYTFGPTFRAENSRTRLHLSEFYMIEAEMAFVDDIEEVAREVELLVKFVTRALVDKGASDMNNIDASEPKWLNEKFGLITYDEALKILDNHADRITFPIRHGDNLSKEHEMFLVQHNNDVPVFVINWPKEIKPFYMKECSNDLSKVAALDLLAPQVGELVGGSVREDDYEKLQFKLSTVPNLAWYLELRKYGNIPTAGFGVGFERFLQCVLGIASIKDTIPFPRWPHNCNL